MGCDAQLAAQLISYISKMTFKPGKPGQTDLVFGSWTEFIGRSVHAGLQVPAFRSYDLCCRG